MDWIFGVSASLIFVAGFVQFLRGENGSRWFWLGAAVFFTAIPFLGDSALEMGFFVLGGTSSGVAAITSWLRERILLEDRRREEETLERYSLKRALKEGKQERRPCGGSEGLSEETTF